jgi:hypothetical protein
LLLELMPPHNTHEPWSLPAANQALQKNFRSIGYLGFLIIVAAEALLFSGNQIVGRWFTPIVWTGYILFVDGLVYAVRLAIAFDD